MAERQVAALSLTERFEAFKDLLSGLFPRPVLAVMNQFPFHDAEETVHAGVV